VVICPEKGEQTLAVDLLPDKLRISMRKVNKRNRDWQPEIQEIFKTAKTHLKEAQITAISSDEPPCEVLA
jgi:hypothetical protein